MNIIDYEARSVRYKYKDRYKNNTMPWIGKVGHNAVQTCEIDMVMAPASLELKDAFFNAFNVLPIVMVNCRLIRT